MSDTSKIQRYTIEQGYNHIQTVTTTDGQWCKWVDIERSLVAAKQKIQTREDELESVYAQRDKAEAEKKQALAECENMRKIILDAELMSETVLNYTLSTTAKEEVCNCGYENIAANSGHVWRGLHDKSCPANTRKDEK